MVEAHRLFECGDFRAIKERRFNDGIKGFDGGATLFEKALETTHSQRILHARHTPTAIEPL
jgi:hypothetical protein